VNEAIAIIPARGGSNRIPRKNIREFHGKPIIAYSIDAARHSKCFGRRVRVDLLYLRDSSVSIS
jgi:CMP-N-acetylneuraminic acid synthetase